MSGHSKWANIKHKKEKADKARGKTFSKVSKIIITAARDGGGDPERNLSLKLAIDQAKAANMPKDVIQRAVDRGVGKTAAGVQFEEALYEAFGPNGVPMLILVSTDNKNRTISALREALANHNGRIADIGSVKWQFDQKGLVEVVSAKMHKSEKFGKADFQKPIDPDEAMLEIMELAPIEDIKVVVEDGQKMLHVFVPFEKLAQTAKAIREVQFVVSTSGVHYAFNQPRSFDTSGESFANLVADLEELDEVQNYWYPNA